MDSAYKLAIEIVANAKNSMVEINKLGGVVDNTTGKIEDATGMNSKFAGSFGAIGAGIGKFMGIAGSVAGVMLFLKNAIGSTEGGADKLEEVTSALNGAWTGLNQTISAGSWEQLVQNIVNTAKATRDAAVAADELENSVASDAIKKGFLERERDAARMAAIESTNAADKQRYIAEAITAQRALSSVTISELDKSLKNTELYYQSRMEWTKEEADYNFKKVREMAGNYDYFFGKDSVVEEGMKKRVEELKYFQTYTLGGLDPVKKDELKKLESTLRTMEIFKTLQEDVSKPGQFNEYVKGIGSVQSANAQAVEDLLRLQRQFESTDKALNKTSDDMLEYNKRKNNETVYGYKLGTENVNGEERAGYGNTKQLLKSPLLDFKKLVTPVDTQTLVKFNEEIRKATEAQAKFNKEELAAEAISENLTGIFTSMFNSIDGGAKAMAESLINSIKQIAAELAAKAAVFALMSIIFPGSSLIKGGLGAFIGIPGMASGGIAYGPTLAQIGEYPGARTDPEVVSPLSKLKGLIGGGQMVPQAARLRVDVGGSMYAYFDYQQRKINNYR